MRGAQRPLLALLRVEGGREHGEREGRREGGMAE